MIPHSRLSLLLSVSLLSIAGCIGTPDSRSDDVETTRSALSGPAVAPGVHFAYHPDDPGHADVIGLFASAPGYSVDLAYAISAQHPVAGVRANIRSIAQAGFQTILRADYRAQVNVPPTAADIPLYVNFVVNQLVVPLQGTVRIFVVGNEPNLDDECRGGPQASIYRAGCTPAHVAQVYRQTRAAVRAANPNAIVLLPGVSPGDIAGVRYRAGTDYLRALLSALSPSEVDGIALHSYGRGDLGYALALFEKDLDEQLTVMKQHGYGAHPVYVTELNRPTASLADEAISARFLAGAYAVMQAHNDMPHLWPRIVAGSWFVYGGESVWPTMSLRALKSSSGTPATDVWRAFAAMAAEGPGARPVPRWLGVHRAYSALQNDHFYTTARAEIDGSPDYQLEYTNHFFVEAEPASGLGSFWRCWSSAQTDHFYTLSSTCEESPDMQLESRLGYIATSPGPDRVPLYRLHRPGDHFYTVHTAERDAAIASHGYRYEGIAGYVWTAP